METEIEVAYLQKKDGEFANLTVFNAWEGFKLLGIHTEFFEHKQLINGYLPIPLSKTTLVCGFIGDVRWALKELGVPDPEMVDYPPELEPYWGREIKSSTMAEIRQHEPRVFIKPKLGHKLFNGHVRTGRVQDLIQTAMIPDETEIYVSEIVNFVTEYRIFVNEGLMVGCCHYKGDFTIYPDFKVISEAIAAYRSAPVGYSADFGVTDDGRTLLVEVNDGFALGSYGLPALPYAKMLRDRWLEMVNA
jgi:hypothetical protein